jgi:hypothetical protein
VREVQYIPIIAPAQAQPQLASHPQPAAPLTSIPSYRGPTFRGAKDVAPRYQADTVHPLYDPREEVDDIMDYGHEVGDYASHRNGRAHPAGVRGSAPEYGYEGAAAYERSGGLARGRQSLAWTRRPVLRQNVMPEDALGYVVSLLCCLAIFGLERSQTVLLLSIWMLKVLRRTSEHKGCQGKVVRRLDAAARVATECHSERCAWLCGESSLRCKSMSPDDQQLLPGMYYMPRVSICAVTVLLWIKSEA